MSRRGRRGPPTLRRRGPSRDPKIKITVVCEGKLTEPGYIYAFARDCGALVAIDLALETGAGVPLSVVQKAITLKPKTHRIADGFDERDEFWAVFDRDEHPNFSDALHRAKAAGVHVAYSNPCFELWVVLHFQD